MRNVTRFAGHERGQALVESVVFIPFALLSLFALLYFSQLGVLQERAQLAVRYGGNVAYQHGQLYTIATLQDLIAGAIASSSSQFSLICVNPNGTNPGSVSSAANDAFTQNEGNAGSSNPGPDAGPSAQPFWRPQSTQIGNCTPTAVSLSTGPSSPVVPVSLAGVTVSGTLNVPPILQSIYGGNATSMASAQWNVINLALPTTLLACNVPLLDVLEVVVGHSQTTGTPPGCPPVSS